MFSNPQPYNHVAPHWRGYGQTQIPTYGGNHIILASLPGGNLLKLHVGGRDGETRYPLITSPDGVPLVRGSIEDLRGANLRRLIAGGETTVRIASDGAPELLASTGDLLVRGPHTLLPRFGCDMDNTFVEQIRTMIAHLRQFPIFSSLSVENFSLSASNLHAIFAYYDALFGCKHLPIREGTVEAFSAIASIPGLRDVVIVTGKSEALRDDTEWYLRDKSLDTYKLIITGGHTNNKAHPQYDLTFLVDDGLHHARDLLTARHDTVVFVIEATWSRFPRAERPLYQRWMQEKRLFRVKDLSEIPAIVAEHRLVERVLMERLWDCFFAEHSFRAVSSENPHTHHANTHLAPTSPPAYASVGV